ncbi:hypothetical protein KOW79_022728 [Hemibagrus wyckioides]|uniref:Amelotin n=1 Tax=Hemibagrus wyckioides TaxID=337641 RepID=A0A9D3N1R2_9TELE|nr:hypothetical protein KOW79_022728 [Hemibagrus wyckioides]
MKLIVFVAFLASAACVISAKKLLVVGGLNGGVVGLNPGVVGVNPGLVSLNGGLLNPGLVVGGVNPALIGGGGAFLAQPAVAPMIPGIPPYMLQPQFGIPNAPAQLPQQFPFQPNGGMPFLPPVNRQALAPQQQAAGQMNPGANGQQPQGDMPTGAILRQQLGIIASNSNEIVRLPGLTLTGMGLGQAQVQGSPFLSPFLIQSQPELLLPPQVLNLGPQVPGPFLPPQQNLPSFILPSYQQEQPTGPINPNNPAPPPNSQDPFQGFPYYMSYGFPQRNTFLKPLPNQNTAVQNAANQNPVRPTKVPQPVQNKVNVLEPLRMTPPPDNRGDRPGRGVEGDPAFPFFQP